MAGVEGLEPPATGFGDRCSESANADSAKRCGEGEDRLGVLLGVLTEEIEALDGDLAVVLRAWEGLSGDARKMIRAMVKAVDSPSCRGAR